MAQITCGSAIGQRSYAVEYTAQRESQIGACVTVGDRINVEIVDLLFSAFQGLIASSQQCARPRHCERRFSGVTHRS
jgi:hypothetical protein